jgi:Domain of unknown function (DUF4249)
VLLAACTIADVTVPPSEDRLVVEAVLRTDFERQAILLHRSVRDAGSWAEPGAEVFVTTETGRQIPFDETPGGCYTVDPLYAQYDTLAVSGTCYVSREADGHWVEPGSTYDLTVRTDRGEEARARTTVPGSFDLVGIQTAWNDAQITPACWLPANTSLELAWTPSAGAWGYLAPLTIFGLSGALPPDLDPPDPMELLGLSITARDTTLVLPGEFGVFERFEYDQDLLVALQAGLPDGTSARVVVAAADRNYINGVRGGTFNPSGQVRISSIAGDGVGVFGSLTARSFAVDVGGPPGSVIPCD